LPAALYTAAEAARLARVPRDRLYEWRRDGIIFPTIFVSEDDHGEDAHYSFDALVYLRLLRMLRDEDVSLPRAVVALRSLIERFGVPGPGWADCRIFIDGNDVYIDRADHFGVTVASNPDALSGQEVAVPLFGEAFAQLRARADSLLVPRKYQKYVEIDPTCRGGRPIVLGTTLPTETIYALHKKGLGTGEILEHYPNLSQPQVRSVVAFERELDLVI